MTETPPVEDLMHPMQFDHHDLSDNRAGKLGMGQIARLKQYQRRNLAIGVTGFLLLTLTATTLLYFGSRTAIFTGLGIFATLLNALLVGMFGRQHIRLQIDIRKGEIEALRGRLERVIKPDRRVGNYMIRVDSAEFYVKKELFTRFQHDEPYVLYRAPYSKVLLAAEPASPNS